MTTIDEDFIEFTLNVGRGYGLDNLTSKLFAIIFLEPEAISMEELAKRTGYSLASISNKMKVLEALGPIHRRKKPKSKKVYYFCEKNFLKIMDAQIQRVLEVEVYPSIRLLPTLIEKYNKKKVTEVEKKKLAIINDTYKNMVHFEQVITEMQNTLRKK